MLAANCDFGGLGMPNASAKCLTYFTQMFALIERVDIYNIFGICYGTSINPALDDILAANPTKTHEEEMSQTRPKSFREKYTRWLGPSEEVRKANGMGAPMISCDYDCSGLLTYLNRQDVRDALHIKAEVVEYLECSGEA